MVGPSRADGEPSDDAGNDSCPKGARRGQQQLYALWRGRAWSGQPCESAKLPVSKTGATGDSRFESCESPKVTGLQNR